MNKVKIIALGIIFLAISLWLVRLRHDREFHLEKQMCVMMDTYVTIYAGGPKKVVLGPMRLARKRMQEVEEKFSAFNLKSPVYAFNHDGTPITNPEILGVVRTALSISRDSGGAFDITIFPLSVLWGFATKTPKVPSEDQIKETLKHVGYQHLILSDGRLTKDDPLVEIDLGGIAKGYVVGEGIKVLKNHGVKSALIVAGGDIYALGKKGSKRWKIGVRNPFKEGILGSLEVEDVAVMGSGDYERFFIKDGKKYHHIFNPKTGYPATGASGVTVISADPVLADAWGPALLVLGPQKGLEIIKKKPYLGAVMVTPEGKIFYSSDQVRTSLRLSLM